MSAMTKHTLMKDAMIADLKKARETIKEKDLEIERLTALVGTYKGIVQQYEEITDNDQTTLKLMLQRKKEEVGYGC